MDAEPKAETKLGWVESRASEVVSSLRAVTGRGTVLLRVLREAFCEAMAAVRF